MGTSDDVKAHNRMLTDGKEGHDSTIDATESRLEGDKGTWVENIANQITEMRSDVENVADLLKNPIIADPDESQHGDTIS